MEQAMKAENQEFSSLVRFCGCEGGADGLPGEAPTGFHQNKGAGGCEGVLK